MLVCTSLTNPLKFSTKACNPPALQSMHYNLPYFCWQNGSTSKLLIQVEKELLDEKANNGFVDDLRFWAANGFSCKPFNSSTQSQMFWSAALSTMRSWSFRQSWYAIHWSVIQYATEMPALISIFFIRRKVALVRRPKVKAEFVHNNCLQPTKATVEPFFFYKRPHFICFEY